VIELGDERHSSKRATNLADIEAVEGFENAADGSGTKTDQLSITCEKQ
jgi:hypothetical protein